MRGGPNIVGKTPERVDNSVPEPIVSRRVGHRNGRTAGDLSTRPTEKHEKTPKKYPGSMLNSMRNRYDSGTFDFLIFAKSITLKSFFHTTPGTGIPSKFDKNNM